MVDAHQDGQEDLELVEKCDLAYKKCAAKRSLKLTESNNLPECRRPTGTAMEYTVGMIVNIGFDVKAVIVSWDLNYNKHEEWLEKKGLPGSRLPYGPYQPFYNIFTGIFKDPMYTPEGS